LRRCSFLLAAASLVLAGTAGAQLRGVKAEVAPLVEADGAHAGSDARVAIRVTLPNGFHVQSNKPRDPNLIPTTLNVSAPAGITVAEIAFPPTVETKLAGVAEPLDVFERSFTIGVRLTVSSTVAPGDIKVPARLRYQACDDTTCFAPTTADVEWPLRVVASDAKVTISHQDVFGGIVFGRGEGSPAVGARTPNPGGTS
jgi:DsbC/DsbD-like thiol-disulfide interchange protein